MRRDKAPLQPMTLNTEQVCQLLGIGSTFFYENLRALQDLGFPRKHPVLKRYPREAVEAWLRKTSGLANPENDPSIEF